jgi:translation elongation factor EF-G
MKKSLTVMYDSENINFQRVEEMAEGDMEFRTQLLNAIYTSIQDLKKKYVEGLTMHNEEIIKQARHKIKPTLSLFELNKLNEILQEGKSLVSSKGFDDLGTHQNKFLQAADELLDDLNKVIN